MAIGIGEAPVGRIVHYYPRINVGIVELTDGEINLGDVIHVKVNRQISSNPSIPSRSITKTLVTQTKAEELASKSKTK
jgi:hypothetical protein